MRWFLNLASEKMSANSLSIKHWKFAIIMRTQKTGERKIKIKKNQKLTPTSTFKKSSMNFLREIKDKHKTIGKKLAKSECEATEAKISMAELEESLEDTGLGKTPGLDKVDKDFLLRYWNLLGPTVYHAQNIYIEQLNRKIFLTVA